MKPVLRVIVESTKFSTAVSTADVLQITIATKGALTTVYNDYMTENLTPPVEALYAALVTTAGAIQVLVATKGTYLPLIKHTFAGWDIP